MEELTPWHSTLPNPLAFLFCLIEILSLHRRANDVPTIATSLILRTSTYYLAIVSDMEGQKASAEMLPERSGWTPTNLGAHRSCIHLPFVLIHCSWYSVQLPLKIDQPPYICTLFRSPWSIQEVILRLFSASSCQISIRCNRSTKHHRANRVVLCDEQRQC